MRPLEDNSGVAFGIDHNAKPQGGNPAQRREYDKKLGAGTMSRAGASCPCCGTIMRPEDLRLESQSGRLSQRLLAVVTEGPDGKEYRLPTPVEVTREDVAIKSLPEVFQRLPFGLPTERVPVGASRSAGGSAFETR